MDRRALDYLASLQQGASTPAGYGQLQLVGTAGLPQCPKVSLYLGPTFCWSTQGSMLSNGAIVMSGGGAVANDQFVEMTETTIPPEAFHARLRDIDGVQDVLVSGDETDFTVRVVVRPGPMLRDEQIVDRLVEMRRELGFDFEIDVVPAEYAGYALEDGQHA